MDWFGWFVCQNSTKFTKIRDFFTRKSQVELSVPEIPR